MKNISLLLVLCLSAFQGIGQKINTVKLDSLFDLLQEHNKFMGSVQLSVDDKIFYSNSIGYIDEAKKHAINQETQFRIGSISKSFTTVLVFKAIEENKLKLEQKIDRFFPKLEESENITIKDLLHHSSGIYNFTNDPKYLDWNEHFHSEDEMIELISEYERVFEPGSKHKYSNSNYILLSYILQDVLGDSYSNLIDLHITTPLNLDHTFVGSKVNLKNNEAASFTYNDGWTIEEETDMSVPVGAGAMVSTPHDLNIFFGELFDGKLINEKSLENMKTIEEGYGMGMFSYPYGKKTSYGHSGGIDGYRSIATYFPEDKLAISLTSNGLNTEMNDITLAILGTYYGDGFDMPNFESVELHPEELDKYLGNYTSKEMPLDILVSKEGGSLTAQATGQGAFNLIALGDHVFTFDQAGIKMTFDPATKGLVMEQGGRDFDYTLKTDGQESPKADIDSASFSELIGNYSSKQMPMEIVITQEKESLFAQATGQSAFPLKALTNEVFVFDEAGIRLEFDRSTSEMLLKQGGAQYNFKKH